MKYLSLDKVCNIVMGQAPPGSSYNSVGDGYPLVAGAGDFGENCPRISKFTTTPTRISNTGDILLCIRATIGDTNWSDRQYCLGRGVAGLCPNPKLSNRLFVWYWLGSVKNILKKYAKGSTFKQVSRGDIESLPFPDIGLTEQKRIAAILDKADAICRKRQQAIQLADDFLRSVFLDMFGDPCTNPKGWEVNLLEELVYFRTGKLDSNAAIEGGSYPFFTCSKKNFQIDTYAFDCEALLLAGNNATAEYSVKYYKGKFNAYQRTYVITILDDQLSYRYLQVALEMKLQDLKRLSKGTNTKYLTLGILNNIMIQVPSKQVRDSFDRIIKKIDQFKAKLRRTGEMTNMNFDSLTQRAFRGEL